MKSKYVVLERNRHLVMNITGPFDYWEFIRYPEIIRQSCESAEVYRILVDLTGVINAQPSTLELFFLGEKLAHKLRNRVKIALVWKGRDQSEFLKNVAINRQANIQVFNTPERARLWLLFKHEDEPHNFQK